MAMIAGYARYLIQTVIPALQPVSEKSILHISRMSMLWPPDSLRATLEETSTPYDASIMDAITEANGHFTSKEFFLLLKFRSYTDLDFDSSEGADLNVDLNRPLPSTYHRRYDAVFENGTLEHIFNVGQALANCAYACKIGGHVIHASPLDALNHGFYNLSINFFHDFYLANGFELPALAIISYHPQWFRGNHSVTIQPISYNPEEFDFSKAYYESELKKSYICSIAKKKHHFLPYNVPIQGAYDKARNLRTRLGPSPSP